MGVALVAEQGVQFIGELPGRLRRRGPGQRVERVHHPPRRRIVRGRLPGRVEPRRCLASGVQVPVEARAPRPGGKARKRLGTESGLVIFRRVDEQLGCAELEQSQASPDSSLPGGRDPVACRVQPGFQFGCPPTFGVLDPAPPGSGVPFEGAKRMAHLVEESRWWLGRDSGPPGAASQLGRDAPRSLERLLPGTLDRRLQRDVVRGEGRRVVKVADGQEPPRGLALIGDRGEDPVQDGVAEQGDVRVRRLGQAKLGITPSVLPVP